MEQTVRGYIDWITYQLEKSSGIPHTIASMEDYSRRKILPRVVVQYARDKGADFDAAGRSAPAEVLAVLFPVLEKIFSGDPSKLADCGVVTFNGIDWEQEKNLRLKNEELQRAAEKEIGELVHPVIVEKLFWHLCVAPLKTYLERLRDFAAQCNPAHPAAAEAVLVNITRELQQLIDPLQPGNLKPRIQAALKT